MTANGLLAFAMFIATIAFLWLRYLKTRVAATPLNLFVAQSILTLFLTYPFLRYGIEMIGWGGISDIIKASDEALLVCALGTAVFLASTAILPGLVVQRTYRANKIKNLHPANQYETCEAYTASLLMLFGSACIWLAFVKTHTIPLLDPVPGVARTFGNTFSAFKPVRPIYQAGNAILSVCVTYVIAWCMVRRSEGRLPLFVCGSLAFSIISLLLTANRSWVLIPVLMGFLIYGCINWRRIGLGRILAFGFVLVVIALGLQAVRWGGSFGQGLAKAPYELVQGDTFSDFRDFSWLLTEFNRQGHRHYMGKTIAAGYLGMLPSSISRFRQDYAWGRVSAAIANLDPEKHFGLRPGPFGEWYFNFGWGGVIVQAMILGLAAGLVDNRVVRLARKGNPERWRPDVFPIFVSWMLFFIICSPLVISAAGPSMLPKIFTLIGIRLIANVLRDARPQAKAAIQNRAQYANRV